MSSHEIDPLLPQPCMENKIYTYITLDELSKKYFPPSKPYPKDMLCWVLKSKGKRSKNSGTREHAKEINKNIQEANDLKVIKQNVEKEIIDDISKCLITSCYASTKKMQGLKTELFKRCRVVADPGNYVSSAKEERVMIRYPKGSTYNVHKSLLIPVLERGNFIEQRIVLVVPETDQYRRASAVHTCIGDSFLEIGCDFGPTIDRVQRVLTEFNDVPITHHTQLNLDKMEENNKKSERDKYRCVALGIDKSDISIEIAKKRYPHCSFFVRDALTEEGMYEIRKLCEEKLVNKYPSVIAIDINGNREISAVLSCLKQVMVLKTNNDATREDPNTRASHNLPRLIIVKSRALYHLLKGNNL